MHGYLQLLTVACFIACCCISARVCVCVRALPGGHGGSDPVVREVIGVQAALGDKREQADSHQQAQPPGPQRANAGSHWQLR